MTHFIKRLLGIDQAIAFRVHVDEPVRNDNPGQEPGSAHVDVDHFAGSEVSLPAARLQEGRVHQSRGAFDSVQQPDRVPQALLTAHDVHGFLELVFLAQAMHGPVPGVRFEECLLGKRLALPGLRGTRAREEESFYEVKHPRRTAGLGIEDARASVGGENQTSVLEYGARTRSSHGKTGRETRASSTAISEGNRQGKLCCAFCFGLIPYKTLVLYA